ncbi:hypothetical protein QYE76_000457 [Lolium multiflorum]|uniref:Reverse transcriptase/retrotransposon-derived protein RNase H-like domain-containing protein n=1 Tax=Lolium multiflorum TaxID=4521 RepID=A0AAD8RL64_LOLMU|nr:hypothetical protein QYE76_000457 [Lolium multiflorum]
MASVCSHDDSWRRVGHEVALAGVHIRAGILDINGERTVSALVQRIYNMDFINDNAGCFANGGKFPQNGRTIEFGSIRVYFGTVPVRQRLSPVLVAPDPPRWLCAGRCRQRGGKVRVDVSFGGRDNCRVENIEFEVVDLDSPYHALRETGIGGFHGLNPYGLPQDEDAGTSWTLDRGNVPAVQKCLFDQIGKNVQVYVDDIVIKTKVKDTFDDIRQTFDNLRRFRMKLNPAKCTFGVPAGKLLGFLVSSRGIEVNPVKIRAIERMTIPGTERCAKVYRKLGIAKPVHKQARRKGLATLCFDEKVGYFRLDHTADAAFKELKNMLVTVPILASPLEREPMLLYIAATNRVVSVVVVVERRGRKNRPEAGILPEVLSSSKQNYPHFQKMTYGVFMAATKLKHYFEEHPMKVVSEAPISDIMGNKDASGRIAQWAIQLSPYVPVYEEEMP